MSTIIGLKELRENTTEIAARVAKGESFTVVKRSQPIFELQPVSDQANRLDPWLEAYVVENRALLDSLSDK